MLMLMLTKVVWLNPGCTRKVAHSILFLWSHIKHNGVFLSLLKLLRLHLRETPKQAQTNKQKKKKKTPKPCALVHACVLCAYVCRVCMRVCFRQPAGRLGTCVEASKSRTSSSSLASSLSSQNVIRWIHTLTNVRFSQTLQTNRSCASIHHSFSSIESKPKAQS